MKLIREDILETEHIEEANADGEKHHYIKGIFLQAEQKNRNGRIYPLPIMEREVARYVKELIETHRAYGELGHPEGPTINLDRVSHMIVELKKDGNNFIGKAKLTETPMGNIAKGLLKSGASLGVSSRALGSLKSIGEAMVVQEDLRLKTAADIVADPSAPDAFVNGIMENVDWFYDPVRGTWCEEKMHETRKAIKKMTMDELEEAKFGIFEGFMKALSSKNRIL